MFNVKGEDLLWLDKANARLTERDREDYARLGLPAGAFESVGLWAPPRGGTGGAAVPQVEGRAEGVQAYYWTVREFVRERFLRFMFAEADDERSQIADLVARVEQYLDKECEDDPEHDATVVCNGYAVEVVRRAVRGHRGERRGRRIALAGARSSDATVAAFLRRLQAGAVPAQPEPPDLGPRGRAPRTPPHRLGLDAGHVVDIHNLHDRAKRFVTGVVIKRLFEQKERMGHREPLHFLVLDELNRYAPREGWSPIKEVLLDVAERGRSLGMILIGAEQTASEVERRVIANSAFRVVGRLDTAEAQRASTGSCRR